MHLESLDIAETNAWKGLKPKKRRRGSKFLSKEEEVVEDTSEKRNPHVFLLPIPKKQKLIPKSTGRKIRLPRLEVSIPGIIGFIHVLLNFLVLFSTIYILGFLLYFVTVDVWYNIGLKKEELRGTIREAKRLYVLNRCDPTTRVPALEQQCGEWDCLIKSGMKGIKYTKIVIEVCAGLADSFISNFSIKSCAIVMSFLIVYFIFKKK